MSRNILSLILLSFSCIACSSNQYMGVYTIDTSNIDGYCHTDEKPAILSISIFNNGKCVVKQKMDKVAYLDNGETEVTTSIETTETSFTLKGKVVQISKFVTYFKNRLVFSKNILSLSGQEFTKSQHNN
ncbi:MAG: hypothetical protein NE330_17865 [Lentisphaeraceae bacterium]|nr:hypothetical protein [Lentisphaeraceae bacterium]